MTALKAILIDFILTFAPEVDQCIINVVGAYDQVVPNLLPLHHFHHLELLPFFEMLKETFRPGILFPARTHNLRPVLQPDRGRPALLDGHTGGERPNL